MTTSNFERAPTTQVVVVGAHLSGLPLNHQLIDLDAVFVSTACTRPLYRLFELPRSLPPKPGMLRVGPKTGTAIDVEVWELEYEQFGRFVAMIPAPLGVGTISLDNGEEVKGFLVESYATEGAEDISAYGGWRSYISTKTKQPS